MTKNIMISLYQEDAQSITSHSIPAIHEVGELFHSCYEMLDDESCESITLSLLVDDETEGWMNSIVSEGRDDSGVFGQILEKCSITPPDAAPRNEASTFEQLLEKCKSPVQVSLH